MSNPFEPIKDSSIWFDPKEFSAVNKKDGMIRIGVIKRAYNEQDTGQLRFLVEVQNYNDKIEINCILMRRFGGVYNYEDYIHQGYKINDKPDPVASFDAKAGDAVLVALLNGQGREGVIIGGLTHAARVTNVKASDGPQYKSEFNGIETHINKDGEFTVTFRGLPTNISVLNETPSAKLPQATYDTSVGTSYYKFDKSGGWIVSDNATSDKQFFKIDKSGGFIELAAGKISLKMTKASEAVSLKAKSLDIDSTDKVSIKTKETSVDSSSKVAIKSPKVAIGKEGAELLDQLAKLVDALGAVQPISPLGPCTPLKATPQWSGVDQVKSKIKEITGTF